jgi:hypothetical protein
MKGTTKQEIAAAFGVNVRYLSDATYVLNHGSPELIARVESGEINLQAALRQLGRTTQKSRNQEKAAMTINLCEAVLDNDLETARVLAAKIVLAHANS